MAAIPNSVPSNGPWIILADGSRFHLYDRAYDHMIRIEPLARALSKTCRFCGHLKEDLFYSVAEHSVSVSERVHGDLNAQRWGLLHDLSEAMLNDIPKPFKPEVHGYKAIEDYITLVLAQRFGLQGPMPAAVHEVDMRMLLTEGRDLCTGDTWMHWDVGSPDLHPYPELMPYPLDHQLAYELFMGRATELGIS